MISAFLILILGNALLYVLARIVASLNWRGTNGEVPLLLAIPMAVGSFLIQVHTTVLLARATELPKEAWFAVPAFIITGLPAALAYVHMVMGSLTSQTIQKLYGWNDKRCKQGTDYSRARTKYQHGDLRGATEEYRRYFLGERKSSPHALFEAATLLETEGLYEDAILFYRQILENFPAENHAWTEAAYRLANIFENSRHDKGAAIFLLRGIVQREPDSKLGHLAGARLMEHSYILQ